MYTTISISYQIHIKTQLRHKHATASYTVDLFSGMLDVTARFKYKTTYQQLDNLLPWVVEQVWLTWRPQDQ